MSDAIQTAKTLKEDKEQCTVIFLFCSKDILINRALNRYGQGALKHIADILNYTEPHIPQLRLMFEDFMVLHTDGGIDLSAIGALNASRERRIEVPTSGT